MPKHRYELGISKEIQKSFRLVPCQALGETAVERERVLTQGIIDVIIDHSFYTF